MKKRDEFETEIKKTLELRMDTVACTIAWFIGFININYFWNIYSI